MRQAIIAVKSHLLCQLEYANESSRGEFSRYAGLVTNRSFCYEEQKATEGGSIFIRFLMMICNQQVVGSNPTAGSLDYQGLTPILAVRIKSVFATFAAKGQPGRGRDACGNLLVARGQTC